MSIYKMEEKEVIEIISKCLKKANYEMCDFLIGHLGSEKTISWDWFVRSCKVYFDAACEMYLKDAPKLDYYQHATEYLKKINKFFEEKDFSKKALINHGELFKRPICLWLYITYGAVFWLYCDEITGVRLDIYRNQKLIVRCEEVFNSKVLVHDKEIKCWEQIEQGRKDEGLIM